MTLTLGHLRTSFSRAPESQVPQKLQQPSTTELRTCKTQRWLGRQNTGLPFLEAFWTMGSHAATAGRTLVGVGWRARASKKDRLLCIY